LAGSRLLEPAEALGQCVLETRQQVVEQVIRVAEGLASARDVDEPDPFGCSLNPQSLDQGIDYLLPISLVQQPASCSRLKPGWGRRDARGLPKSIPLAAKNEPPKGLIRMKRALLVFATLALVFTTVATAAPPYWWYTQKKANRALIALNPQLWQDRDGHQMQTTVLASHCKGQPAAKRYRHVRYYKTFICSPLVRNEADQTTWQSSLLCLTSKAVRGRLHCIRNG
jgi:hypothetical protein